MCGGNIEMTCPGDGWVRAGRNVNLWAGVDFVARAKHSWDITATERDGRLKAERNMLMLSGNAGIGGTLIESRGAGPLLGFDKFGEEAQISGVIIRSPKSPAVVWSNYIYLRTGGGNISDGPIVLDAGRGESPITLYAQVQQHYLSTGAFWHFGTVEETVDGPTAAIAPGSSVFPGDMCIGGGVIAGGGAIFDGGVISTSAFAAPECPFVACLEGDAMAAVQESVGMCKELMETTLPQDVGQSFMDGFLKPTLYEGAMPGSDDIILKGEVSLRIQDDYQTKEFILYEDRWQQLDRLTRNNGVTWTEKAVLCQGQETYPYPGKEAFEAGDNFIQQDLEIFDARQGRAKDRGSQPTLSSSYSDPEFNTPTKASLDSYTVIR